MATMSLLCLIAAAFLMTTSFTAAARVFPLSSLLGPGVSGTGGGGTTGLVGDALDCWNALYEIKSCGKEIGEYFADGAIDITTQCCQSVALITHRCWPTLLTTLGYTSDQAYILRGYCDATVSSAAILGPVHSPQQAESPLSGPVRSPQAQSPILGPVSSLQAQSPLFG